MSFYLNEIMFIKKTVLMQDKTGTRLMVMFAFKILQINQPTNYPFNQL